MKKLKTKKRNTKLKLSFWNIVLIFLAIFFCAGLIRDLHIEYRLSSNGIIGTAHIYKYTHGRGAGRMYYHFYYPDKWYIWEGRCAGKKEYSLGQAIDIMFLPDNPRINRPWYEMKKKTIVKKRLAKRELKEVS